jgi:hypothetical protein
MDPFSIMLIVVSVVNGILHAFQYKQHLELKNDVSSKLQASNGSDNLSPSNGSTNLDPK